MEVFESLPLTTNDDAAELVKRRAPPPADAALVRVPQTPRLAFEKFAGQLYDPGSASSNADFSDSSVRAHLRALGSQQTCFSGVGDAAPSSTSSSSSSSTKSSSLAARRSAHFEAPLERYHRLLAEIGGAWLVLASSISFGGTLTARTTARHARTQPHNTDNHTIM
jgi:hypothetical protein